MAKHNIKVRCYIRSTSNSQSCCVFIAMQNIELASEMQERQRLNALRMKEASKPQSLNKSQTKQSDNSKNVWIF